MRHFILILGLLMALLIGSGAAFAEENPLVAKPGQELETVIMNYCSTLLDDQDFHKATKDLTEKTEGATLAKDYHQIKCFRGELIWDIIVKNPDLYDNVYYDLMEYLSEKKMLRKTLAGRYKNGEYLVDPSRTDTPISKALELHRESPLYISFLEALADFMPDYRDFDSHKMNMFKSSE